MKAFKKYLIAFLVGLGFALWIMVSKDLFSQTELVKVYHILCDAFFVPGVLLLCSGLLVFSSEAVTLFANVLHRKLVFSSNEGTFDMIIYGCNSFWDLFRKKSKKKYPTFYDYRESKAGKKVKYGFLLICGGVYTALAGIMYLLYSL